MAISFRSGMLALKPVLMGEGEAAAQADRSHRPQFRRIPPLAGRFRPVLKVHPPYPGDHGRNGGGPRPCRDAAHVDVLLQADELSVRPAQIQHIPVEVVGLLGVGAPVGGEDLLLDSAQGQPRGGLMNRRRPELMMRPATARMLRPSGLNSQGRAGWSGRIDHHTNVRASLERLRSAPRPGASLDVAIPIFPSTTALPRTTAPCHGHSQERSRLGPSVLRPRLLQARALRNRDLLSPRRLTTLSSNTVQPPHGPWSARNRLTLALKQPLGIIPRWRVSGKCWSRILLAKDPGPPHQLDASPGSANESA